MKVLIEKVDYLSYLKANALVLTNIISTSNSFVKINKAYGTIDEFENFLNYSKSKNIKILMDFIPNYTTDEHEWFRESLIDDKYRDYYIWSKETINNWVI